MEPHNPTDIFVHLPTAIPFFLGFSIGNSDDNAAMMMDNGDTTISPEKSVNNHRIQPLITDDMGM